jgi:hypothetical protein
MANCLPGSAWAQGYPSVQLLRRRVPAKAWSLGFFRPSGDLDDLRRSLHNSRAAEPSVSGLFGVPPYVAIWRTSILVTSLLPNRAPDALKRLIPGRCESPTGTPIA